MQTFNDAAYAVKPSVRLQVAPLVIQRLPLPEILKRLPGVPMEQAMAAYDDIMMDTLDMERVPRW